MKNSVREEMQGIYLRKQTFWFMRLGSGLALRIGDVWDGRRFRPRVRVARKHLKGRHAGVDLPLHPAARSAIGR